MPSTIILVECDSCKYIWSERLDLPMVVEAFTARLRAMSICPSCGNKKSFLLLGPRYKEAYNKLFGKEAPEGPTPFEGSPITPLPVKDHQQKTKP